MEAEKGPIGTSGCGCGCGGKDAVAIRAGKVSHVSQTEIAMTRFKSGLSCSQAVLSVYGPQLGIDYDIAVKVSSSFGGGIGRMGETCGAVTGALMALGLLYDASEPNAKAISMERARDFMARFKEHHKSIICKELIDCDLSTPEGLAYSRQSGNTKTICPQLVKDAAEILEEMIQPS